jgi:hypothetical protein
VLGLQNIKELNKKLMILTSSCKVIFLLVFSFHHSVLESLLMPDLTSSLLPTTSHHLHNKQIIR